MKKVSKSERVAYRGIDASNIISKSLHASSTVGIKVEGTICLDNCAAEGKTCSNNDFGRRNSSLVTGRNRKNEQFDKNIRVFHLLLEDLPRTSVLASKDNADENKRRFDGALENQFVKRHRKEDITLEKKYEDATEDYIDEI